MYTQQLEHFSPRLTTIRMVESVLKNSDSVITVAQLKRKLPKQVNHYTLQNILEYLEESNKIVFSSKGITWIMNDNPNLRKLIEKGTRH